MTKTEKYAYKLKSKTPGLIYIKLFRSGKITEGFEFEGLKLFNIIDIYNLRKRLYTLKDIEKASFETLLGSNYSEFNFGEENDIDFHSNFDSGNLSKCIKGEDGVYYLEMSPDTNSAGHQRWFHFATSHCKKGERVKFRIINYGDPKLLVKQVQYMSKKDFKRKEIGWRPIERDVKYFSNNSCSYVIIAKRGIRL